MWGPAAVLDSAGYTCEIVTEGAGGGPMDTVWQVCGAKM